MSGRILLTLFALFTIVMAACSDGKSDEYLDLNLTVGADVRNVLGSIQFASAQPIDTNANDARERTREYRLEISELSGKVNALNFRWNAVVPPEKYQVHYDLSSQVLDKLATALSLIEQGAAYIENELTAFFRNYDEGFDLIDQGIASLKEASEFSNLAIRELQ
jgi:hypothetical protein